MRRPFLSWKGQLVLSLCAISAVALGSFILLFWNNARNATLREFDSGFKALFARQGQPLLAAFRQPRGGRGDAFRHLSNQRAEGELLPYALQEPGKTEPEVSANWPDSVDAAEAIKSVVKAYAEQGLPYHDFGRPVGPPQGPAPHAWDRPFPQGQGPPPAPPVRPPPPLETAILLTPPGFTGWRLLGISDGTRTLVALRGTGPIQFRMKQLRDALLLAVPSALLIIAATAWLLACRAIRPVDRLGKALARVNAADLSGRLSAEGETIEFSALVEAYNRMLERLEKSFQQARRFSSDAAHELNTPLTILKGHLDELLQAHADRPGVQQTTAILLEETHRLQEIIRKLLLLSKVDSGHLKLDRSPIDLKEMILEIVEEQQLQATGLSWKTEIEPVPPVSGDPGLIRQCIHNLVSNAVKYNQPGGFVLIRLTHAPPDILMEITNSGISIPDEARERIFDRFFRVEEKRTEGVSGRGLGLSLAREMARAHSGDVVLAESRPGRTGFRLRLPVEDSPG